MWCENKDDVKRSIRQNSMAYGNRGIGKTQGLLEVIHEDHNGSAILFVPFATLARIVRKRYKEAFPADKQPYVCSTFSSLHDAIVGRDLPVYVDTFDLVHRRDEERVHQILRGRVNGCY